jgi:hypothetical protein
MNEEEGRLINSLVLRNSCDYTLSEMDGRESSVPLSRKGIIYTNYINCSKKKIYVKLIYFLDV